MSDTSRPLDHTATRSTVEGNFQTYEGNLGRILDPVHHKHIPTTEVLKIAEEFERYLMTPLALAEQKEEPHMPDPRELDPIRREALFRALEACHINGAADAQTIVVNAKEFERYLTGTDD